MKGKIPLLNLREFTDTNKDNLPDGWATNCILRQYSISNDICLKINN